MNTTIVGIVSDGYKAAGDNLKHVLPIIEERSGLAGLIPNTLNVKLQTAFRVIPDFVLVANEYNGTEELRFKHCSIEGHPCLIMRPHTHEDGAAHGPGHLEIMSNVWLRQALGLETGSEVTVQIGEAKKPFEY